MEKTPSCNVDKSLIKLLDQDPDADDLQNLMVSSMSKDASLVKFSQRSDQ